MLIWIVAALVLLGGFMVAFGAPYVPTRPRELRRAFGELYNVKPTDCLVDIGSGDGVVLRAFIRLSGRRAVGYEINPVLVFVSKIISRHHPAIEIHLANFWRAEFPVDTTVVYVFGDSRDIRRIQRKVQAEASRLGRPLHLISYGFQLADQKPIKQRGAHFLYTITPLQGKKAQV